jgi:hypothetical protein
MEKFKGHPHFLASTLSSPAALAFFPGPNQHQLQWTGDPVKKTTVGYDVADPVLRNLTHIETHGARSGKYSDILPRIMICDS